MINQPEIGSCGVKNDPGRGVIAAFWPTAHISIYTRILQPRRQLRRQQHFILSQAGIPPPALRARTILEMFAVLADAGNLRRFQNHSQFLKFCGMDLTTMQFGTFRSRSKISKYGNARLRRTLGRSTRFSAWPETIKPIHPTQMPAILDPADHETWQDDSTDDAAALLRPFPADRMRIV